MILQLLGLMRLQTRPVLVSREEPRVSKVLFGWSKWEKGTSQKMRHRLQVSSNMRVVADWLRKEVVGSWEERSEFCFRHTDSVVKTWTPARRNQERGWSWPFFTIASFAIPLSPHTCLPCSISRHIHSLFSFHASSQAVRRTATQLPNYLQNKLHKAPCCRADLGSERTRPGDLKLGLLSV